MTPNSSVSRTVMRRVRILYGIRAATPVFAASFLFVLALWGIGREVWVAKVFENMSSYADAPGMLSFLTSAFLNTDIVVQALSILALGALIWLARSFAIAIGESFTTRRI
ncbi:MAG: hypothetical protein Q8S35_00015 [bacterium]|nr:hypothetical protein [bacterium]